MGGRERASDLMSALVDLWIVWYCRVVRGGSAGMPHNAWA